MSLTTLKVPVELRDRITGDARSENKTVAAFLDSLVDEWERTRRFASVREAYAALPDVDNYAAESAEWDVTSTDGLHDA